MRVFMFSVVIWAKIIKSVWVGMVNTQLQHENNTQKQLYTDKSEIPLFMIASHPPSPPPSHLPLLLFLVLQLLCRGLELKHGLSVYFLWVAGPSSAQLRCIGFWSNARKVAQGLCAYLNCNVEYTNQTGRCDEARTHTHTSTHMHAHPPDL